MGANSENRIFMSKRLILIIWANKCRTFICIWNWLVNIDILDERKQSWNNSIWYELFIPIMHVVFQYIVVVATRSIVASVMILLYTIMLSLVKVKIFNTLKKIADDLKVYIYTHRTSGEKKILAIKVWYLVCALNKYRKIGLIYV